MTLARARADHERGLSRDPEFHRAAHRRFRTLLPSIPADQVFDSEVLTAEQIAAAVARTLGL